MKRLLIVLNFFVLANFVNAQQKDTINNATITVGNTTYSNVTIIIPKQSSGGVNKFYVDSSVANKALQSYVNNAIFNLQNSKQNLLTAGQNVSIVNNVISATGGSLGTLPIIYTNVDGDIFDLRPLNYNPSLKQPSFGMFLKEFPVNGVGVRPNEVFSMGWNTSAGGGQRIAGEPSSRFGMEDNFYINGIRFMEEHLFEGYTRLGMQVRLGSFYWNTESGEGSMNMQLGQFNYKMFNNANIDWYSGNIDNSGNVIMRYKPTNSTYVLLGANNLDNNYVIASAPNKITHQSAIAPFNFIVNNLDILNITKDGLELNGKKVIVDANGFLKVQ